MSGAITDRADRFVRSVFKPKGQRTPAPSSSPAGTKKIDWKQVAERRAAVIKRRGGY